MTAAWPGSTAAYNCIMHTHQAMTAYIIERMTCAQDRKLALLVDLRKMKTDLQLGCIEGMAADFEAAAQKWSQFELHRIFMNTLNKKFEQFAKEKKSRELIPERRRS